MGIDFYPNQARDADAVAWWQAVVAGGGTVSGVQLRTVSTLIRGLKADGVWPTLDRLWLFAAENSTQALVDIVTRSTATIVVGGGAPVFTAGRGYRGQNSGFINTVFNPSNGSPRYVRDGAAFGCWVEAADSVPANGSRLMGNDPANAGEFATSAGNYNFGVNQAADVGSLVSATSTGSFHFSRVASSGAGSANSYQNGVLTVAVNSASIAIPSNNFFALAGNNAGAAYQPTNARLAATYMGGALSAGQIGAFYIRLRAYMTAAGVA